MRIRRLDRLMASVVVAWRRRHDKILAHKSLPYQETIDRYKAEIQKIINNADHYRSTSTISPTDVSGKTLLTDYREIYSGLDDLGNVLMVETSDETKVYRGILPHKAEFFMQMFSCGILQSLAAEGRIVKIKLTDYYTKTYPLIVEIEMLFIGHPSVWTFAMLRECAINILIIREALQPFGYTLLDGHGSNAAFCRNRPVFFDIGSFVKKGGNSWFDTEFYRYYICALLMLSIPDSFWGRYLLSFGAVRQFPSLYHIDESLEWRNLRKRFLCFHRWHSCRIYRKVIHKLLIDKQLRPEYIDLAFGRRYADTHEFYLRENAACIISDLPEKIRQYAPDAKTALVLAGGKGEIGERLEAGGQFSRTISIDASEHAIDEGRKLHTNSRLHLLFHNPFGVLLAPKEFTSQLLRSDIAILPNMTPLKKMRNSDAILAITGLYSSKYVVVGVEGNIAEEIMFEKQFKKQFRLLHTFRDQNMSICIGKHFDSHD
ncbi:MAG: hypothetical protein LBR66_06240 [Candidatus Symbiothrix sp.]|jgi:hypothetical protein|nr:hypothetical protein [Candidatus Symbiothrix sp.]